jgi:hypothetical protein
MLSQSIASIRGIHKLGCINSCVFSTGRILQDWVRLGLDTHYMIVDRLGPFDEVDSYPLLELAARLFALAFLVAFRSGKEKVSLRD